MRFLTRRLPIRKPAIALLGTLVLAGCEAVLSGATLDAPTPNSDTVETIEVDVIAPEAFSITDKALWDGRPTFGGVWIAYPDIEKPERVRIRNDATGKEVIGALYKRERDFPGPKIELSADAAAALGVLAGTPAELTIVALRRKTVEVVVVAPEPEPTDMTVPLRRPTPVAAIDPKVEAPEVAAPIPTPIVTTDIEESALPPVTSPSQTTDGQGTYLQVATLQSKSRAETTVAKLTTAGLDVEIRERQVGEKTLYRIIVGPAKTPEALEILLGVVNELGYTDAIILG